MVSVARALLNDNRLILVDEPTKGLAPKIVAEVADALAEAAKTVPILLVEQNLEVVRRLADGAIVIGGGRVVHTGPRARDPRRRRPHPAPARRPRGRASHATEGDPMSTLVLTLITGVGLGALYFLVASGLSLIYGLMHVLNFAHGAFLTLSAFIGWMVAQALGTESWGSFLASIARRRDRRRRRSRRSPSSCSSGRCTSGTSSRCS